MLKVRVDFAGDVLRDLQNLGDGAKPAAKRVFQAFVNRVVPKAKALAPDAPEGSGVDLKESIRGRVTTRKAGMITASVIAGGDVLIPHLAAEGRKDTRAAASSYPHVQHEDPTLSHAHGQANYVGQPFMEEVGSVAEELDREVQNAVR